MDCIFEGNKLLSILKLNIKRGTNAKVCCHIVLVLSTSVRHDHSIQF